MNRQEELGARTPVFHELGTADIMGRREMEKDVHREITPRNKRQYIWRIYSIPGGLNGCGNKDLDMGSGHS